MKIAPAFQRRASVIMSLRGKQLVRTSFGHANKGKEGLPDGRWMIIMNDELGITPRICQIIASAMVAVAHFGLTDRL